MTTKTGQCHCGAVKYEVNGDPARMAQCHCNACRRTTGTGHNVQAFFAKTDVSISGETTSHNSTSDKGNARTRQFCTTCGSRLFSQNSAMPDHIGIAAGSFNDSSWFQPAMIVYANHRPNWDHVDPSVEQHDG